VHLAVGVGDDPDPLDARHAKDRQDCLSPTYCTFRSGTSTFASPNSFDTSS
jgi:hypothetical protein